MKNPAIRLAGFFNSLFKGIRGLIPAIDQNHKEQWFNIPVGIYI